MIALLGLHYKIAVSYYFKDIIVISSRCVSASCVCLRCSAAILEWFSSIRRWTFKKIPSKNFNFFWSKNIFEKNIEIFHTFFGFFSIENWFFKNQFSIEKNQKNIWKFSIFFSKLFFDQKKLLFFDRIFFKVHLLIQENRFEAVLERFRQFRAKKIQGKKVLSGN